MSRKPLRLSLLVRSRTSTPVSYHLSVLRKYLISRCRHRYQLTDWLQLNSYWDFAANPDLPDIVLSKKEIEVETPTGKKTIKNPLYCYNFGTIDRSDFPV